MPFNVQGALAAGYTQAQIDQYLQSRQLQGVARLPAMVGSEALSGLETVAGLPGSAMQAANEYLFNPVAKALGGRPAPPPPLPTVSDLTGATNRLGLTNNVALMPGMGAHPELERLAAGAARGAGAAIPTLGIGGVPAAVGLGLGGLGGTLGEATQEAFPDSRVLSMIAAMAPAGVGGALATIGREAPNAAAGLSAVEAGLNDLTDNLGAPNATMFGAGKNIQAYLDQAKNAAITGVGQTTKMPLKDINRLLNMRSDRAASSLLNDPDNLQILNAEAPTHVDTLAAAMINRNPRQFTNLQPEAQDNLLSQFDQDRLNELLRQQNSLVSQPPAPSRLDVPGGLMLQEFGTGMGAAAAHLLGLPFGDVAGGVAGAMGALGLSMLRGRAAAAAIIDPWVRGAMAPAGAGAYGGSFTGGATF